MELPVLTDSLSIMTKHMKLRKLAISYWDFFTFSFSYCLIYPLINRYSHSRQSLKIIGSLILSYYLLKSTLKFYVRIFNRRDYSKYRTFCLKYKLEESTLF